MTEPYYDIAIIGGGLAGLTSSIQLAKLGHTVILFEKEAYPFHKVCGEYISMESWDHLESLGLPLSTMQLPRIEKLIVSAPGGATLRQSLPLGGFGISRYTLDQSLKNIAVAAGVTVKENCKVNDVFFGRDIFRISSTAGTYSAKVCCGSYGKRSNLDVKWKRGFVKEKPNRLNQFIAVKYHIKTDFDRQTIALHNFKDGYCGISAIEDGKYCLCYLTKAANLKDAGNDIPTMEREVLGRNAFLKDIIGNAEILYETPVTISQVSFSKKTQVEDHVLMIGDAAGMITPLCGNGMSMAMHAGKIACGYIDSFLKNGIARDEMENQYSKAWQQQFAKRLATGRLIQRFFGKVWMTNMFVKTMKLVPGLTRWLIRKTHGTTY